MARGDKTFQYVARPRTPPSSPQPATPGSPQDDSPHRRRQRGGKVRVKEGDRCVPPARSRPKERQAIGPHDGDTVQWGDETMTVEQIVATQVFPLLIKVRASGSPHSMLRMGQVLQVHSASVHQGVRVQDSTKRQMLLPKDISLDLQLMGTNDRGWMKLGDALETRELPLKARVMSLTSSPTLPWLEGQDLEVLNTEDLPFLKANTIDDGWIDQMHVTLLPSILEAKFCIAEGMRLGDDTEWEGISNMFKRSVRHLNFSIVTGFPGVYVQEEESYIPVHLEPFDESIIIPIAPEKPPTQTPVLSESGGNINQAYEADDPEISASAPVLSSTPPRPSVHSRNAREIDTLPNPRSPSPQLRASTPFSDDDEDVEQMFDKVIKVGKETLERMRRETEQKSRSLFTTYVNLDIQGDQNMEMKPLERQDSTPKDGEESKQVKSSKEETKNSSFIKDKKDSQKKAKGKPAVGRKPVENRRRSSSKQKEFEEIEKPAATSTDSGTPMGIIQPTFITPGASSNRIIRSMADVPESLENLTVDEVCTCLALLNMHVHIPEFRRHLIDGRLLVDMREKILLSEFHFTPFNASKLARFVRGWRPNLS